MKKTFWSVSFHKIRMLCGIILLVISMSCLDAIPSSSSTNSTNLTTTTESPTITLMTTPNTTASPDPHDDLSKKASLIVGLGFIPGMLVLYLCCRYVPDYVSKLTADK
ncbi:uncharacterized protein LOC130657726 [Hydractinia symbiolongicarpus]|uniref:uncharacterized protein LOC130657726 n=1 Tax=Hydractinia symbiolongicarpus TaxID=13093 RepID=UPI002550D032|nr:uncharacterized protein LOC130657726 [Hydractinia symbiolongicarpus]